MKILAIGLIPDQESPAEFMINEDEDTDLLWEWYRQGLLQAAYLPADAVGNVLLLEWESISHALKLLNRLPAVSSGLIRFALTELAPIPELQRKIAQSASPGTQR